MRKENRSGRPPSSVESPPKLPREAARSPLNRPPRWSNSLAELAAAKRALTELPAVDDSTLAGAVVPSGTPRRSGSAPPASHGEPKRQPSPSKSPPAAPPNNPAQGSLPTSPREPIAARLEGRRARLAADLRRGAPCWLTSLLVHLLAVIVLGSLVTQSSTQRHLVAIVASFTALDESPLETSVVNVSIPRDEGSIEGFAQPQHAEENDDPFAAPEKPSLPPTPLAASPAVALQHAAGDQATAQTGGAVMANLEQSGPRLAATPLPIEGLHPDAAADPNTAADERRLDEIVDRFIEFDVGRLRGAAGAKARLDFDALGPESIPALVRGLNKAAQIRASCPVMMISAKLQSALSANRDRSLLEYAVDNLGRNVPTSAPYAAQVKAIREHWGAVAGRNATESGVALLRELRQFKSEHRLKAILSVPAAQEGLNKLDRAQIGWALTAGLKSRDARIREATRQALIALAGGEDFGPAEDARPSEVQQAVCQWCRHFDAERFDSQAQGLLKIGTGFEGRDQRSAAARCYRRVVMEFAGSPASEEAAWRIDELKALEKAKRR